MSGGVLVELDDVVAVTGNDQSDAGRLSQQPEYPRELDRINDQNRRDLMVANESSQSSEGGQAAEKGSRQRTQAELTEGVAGYREVPHILKMLIRRDVPKRAGGLADEQVSFHTGIV